MLTYWDLLLVVLCHYSLNLIQPIVDKVINFIVSKIGEKMISYSLDTVFKKYIPKKFKKSKVDPVARGPNDKRTPKNIDIAGRRADPLFQQYKNGGVGRVFDLFSTVILVILENTVKEVNVNNVIINDETKSDKVKNDTSNVEVESDTDEAEILRNYRNNKSSKKE